MRRVQSRERSNSLYNIEEFFKRKREEEEEEKKLFKRSNLVERSPVKPSEESKMEAVIKKLKLKKCQNQH